MKMKSKVQSLTPTVRGAESKVPRLKSKVQGPTCGVQGAKSKVRSRADRRPAAVERLASFLSVWLALALLAAGCAGPRPLKGGKAVTTHKPGGVIKQTVVQGENPSQPTKQDQESVKVRTYTLPAGSRVEQPQTLAAAPAQLSTINSQPINLQPSTLNPQPSTTFLLARIFHKGIEQRSGEGVRRLDITEPNESTTRRFFYDRL